MITIADILRSLVLEANPTLPKREVDKLVVKYLPATPQLYPKIELCECGFVKGAHPGIGHAYVPYQEVSNG